jgi:NitT/TauT family transport system substrate-binding protein
MPQLNAGLKAALCALGLFSAAVDSAPVKLTITHGISSQALAAYIAQQEGIFQKHDIDASLTPVGVPQNMLAGLFAGSAQIIMTNASQMLTAVNGGLDFVVIAGGSRANPSNDPAGLMLRNDIRYTTPSDLKGLTIGVPGFNSSSLMVFKQWLVDKRVEEQQINFVEALSPQMSVLLKGKQLDGVLAVEPYVSAIVKDGTGKLAARYFSEVIPNRTSELWVSTRAWANRNPGLITAFRQSLDEAAKFIAANPGKARLLEEKVFGTAEKDLPTFDLKVVPQDLAAIYQIGKRLGVYDKDIDVTKLVVN